MFLWKPLAPNEDFGRCFYPNWQGSGDRWDEKVPSGIIGESRWVDGSVVEANERKGKGIVAFDGSLKFRQGICHQPYHGGTA